MTEQSRQSETIQPIAEAQDPIRPDMPGSISFAGRVWSAISLQANISAGSRVVIIGKKESTLIVEPISHLGLHQFSQTKIPESSSSFLAEKDKSIPTDSVLIGSNEDDFDKPGDDWIPLDSVMSPFRIIHLVDPKSKDMPVQKGRPRNPNRYFQGKGERVIAFSSGGAFLGGMIAQIPGAVVGALLAVVFAAVYKPRGVKERES